MDEIITQQSGCLQTTLDIMGDKWTGRILQVLSSGPLPFSALETTLQHISPRTLSQRLDMLESENILVKQLYCEHPPRSNYQLTAKGSELLEVLDKMAEWGARYHPKRHCHLDGQVSQS
jgi:DNA-binding HxlR family transcriptional regulator